MDRHHSKHHYSKNKNHRSRSHSHEKDKYRDEKQENTSHAKEMKMDKIIFFLADDENNPKKLKLYEYYTKFIAFKTKFKQEMAKFQPEPAHQDKIWGQWVIRNLNQDKKIFHPIPNPEICKNDKFIIQHMLERKCKDEKQAQNIYQSLLQDLKVVYDSYAQFKLDDFQKEENQLFYKDCYKIIKNSKENKKEIDEIVAKYKKCFLLDVHQFIMEKLIKYYKGKPEFINYNLFELIYSYEVLDFVTKQYCLPLEVMNTLYTKFKVRNELFASPLNTFFKSYCSLFQIDKMFGSYGSFYELVEENVDITGRCQCNPPHIEEEYNKSAQYIDKLLQSREEKDKELLITYFIPWNDCQGYKTLKASKFLIDEIVLKEFEHHEYILTEDRFVVMKLKTYMITLGTKKARENYNQSKDYHILSKDLVYDFKNCKNYKGIYYVE